MRYEWSPRREIRELQAQIEQAFRAAESRERATRPVGNLAPPLDFVSSPEAYYVLIDLPGIGKDDVQVQVERGALIISGKKSGSVSSSGKLLRTERHYGNFSRMVPLPQEADLGDVTATLQQGELEIRVGRRTDSGPRRIEIAVQ